MFVIFDVFLKWKDNEGISCETNAAKNHNQNKIKDVTLKSAAFATVAASRLASPNGKRAGSRTPTNANLNV